MRLFFIFILLILCSCDGHEWPATVLSDDKHILSVIEDLNGQLKPKQFYTNKEDSYIIHISVVPLEFPTLGITYNWWNGCDVLIDKNMIDEGQWDLLKAVVWHEMGHCAGMNHVDTEGEIMYYAAKPFWRYSDEAIRNFIRELNNAINGV